MRMAGVLLVLGVLGATLIVYGATRKVDFSDDAVGQPPKGFEFGHTAKAGAPGKWLVQAEGSNKYLVQTDPDSTRARFPVAVLADITAADVDVSVRIRPVSGRIDQAGGLVWRYRNEDNYYIVRANALENNVVLYNVENGTRTDLPVKGEGRTYGKKANVPAGQWSTLRVVVWRQGYLTSGSRHSPKLMTLSSLSKRTATLLSRYAKNPVPSLFFVRTPFWPQSLLQSSQVELKG